LEAGNSKKISFMVFDTAQAGILRDHEQTIRTPERCRYLACY